MLQDLERFETGLRGLTRGQDNLRPFVCAGSPFECQIFLVGFNPATGMSVSFWEFWDAQSGFNKKAWYESYLADRKKKATEKGRKRYARISPTRRVLNTTIKAADSVKFLETNLYALPTPKAKDLAASQRNTEIFDFLVKTIRPKIVVLHGNDAAKHAERLPTFCEVYSVPHFAHHWSELDAKELGKQLQEILKGERSELDLERKVATRRASR